MKPFNTVLLTIALAIFPSMLFGQWSADQKISTMATTAGLNENMGMCLAVSGDSVHVVWTNTKSGDRGVYYKHSFDGGVTWTGETKLTGSTSNSDLPSIAASGSVVHIMWRDTIGSQNVNYYIRSLDGGKTWGPKVLFGNWYWWPSITCSGNMVFVALNSNDPGNSEVWFRRSMDNGTTWDSVKRISNALGRSEDPSISASAGHVYLVWNDNRDSVSGVPKMQAYARMSSDNGVTWGPETLWNRPPTKSYFPFVHAVGPNVDLVWGDLRGNYEIFYKHSTDYGATWSAEQQLSSGTLTSAYPVIARDGSDVHIVWWYFSGDLIYRHSSDGGSTWDPELSLVSVNSKPGQSFVETGGGKAVHVIWTDQRDGYHAIYYKRNTPRQSSVNLVVPSVVDFGAVKVGNCMDTLITLRNTGTASVNILDVVLADSGSGFSVVNQGASTIAPMGSTTITLRFCPVKSQSYAGTLTIKTDESSSNSPHISLAGRGVAPKLESSANHLDFGNVDSGSNLQKTFTISNNGDAPATITSFSITGSSMFAVELPQTPITITAGGMSVVSISFHPIGAGAVNATLTIGVEEGNLPQVTLIGTGIGKKDTTGGGTAFVSTTSPNINLLEVSPNPAFATAALRIGVSAQLEDVSIAFCDAAGRVIRTQPVGSLPPGLNSIPLRLPSVSGIVFIRITSHEGVIGTRVLSVVR